MATPDDVLAFERVRGEDARAVAVNFLDATVRLPGLDSHVATDWEVELSSEPHRYERPWDGQLGPTEAVLLRPATR